MCRPFRLRKFDSGVMVIQSVSQSDDEVSLISSFPLYSLHACQVKFTVLPLSFGDCLLWVGSAWDFLRCAGVVIGHGISKAYTTPN